MSNESWQRCLDSQLNLEMSQPDLKGGTLLYQAVGELGYLQLQGKKVIEFMQGQFTADVKALKADNFLPSTYCNLQGRVVSFFNIFMSPFTQEGDVLLQMPKSLIGATTEILNKYGMFSKIKLTDRSNELGTLTLSKQNVAPLLSYFPPLDHANKASNVSLEHDNHQYQLLIHDNRIEVIAGFDGLHALWAHLQPIGHCQPNLYLCQLIQNGTPLIEAPLSEQFLPFHLNLIDLGAVSFDKGCYLGQEIIARVHYKGAVKKHLHPFAVNDEQATISPGDKIINQQDAKPLGTIIQAVKTGSKIQGLACLDDKYTQVEKCALEKNPQIAIEVLT